MKIGSEVASIQIKKDLANKIAQETGPIKHAFIDYEFEHICIVPIHESRNIYLFTFWGELEALDQREYFTTTGKRLRKEPNERVSENLPKGV